jgi:hypothetical protein
MRICRGIAATATLMVVAAFGVVVTTATPVAAAGKIAVIELPVGREQACDPPSLDISAGELIVVRDIFREGGVEVATSVLGELLTKVGFRMLGAAVGAVGALDTIRCAFELGIFDDYRSTWRNRQVVVPSASLSPDVVSAGGETTATGCGWIPGHEVRVSQEGPGVSGGGGTIQANSLGCIDMHFRIAPETPRGIVIGLLFSQDVPSNRPAMIMGTNRVPVFLAVLGDIQCPC